MALFDSIAVVGTPVSDSNPGTLRNYGSVTPGGSRAICMAVLASGVAGATVPSIDTPTWLNGAWESFEIPDTAAELEIWFGQTVASPSADDVTVDYGADTLTGILMILFTFLGADLSDIVRGSNVQTFAANSATASGTLPNSLASSANGIIAIVGKANTENSTAQDGGTELAESTHTAPTRGLTVNYELGDNAFRSTWSTATDWGAYGFEINAAADFVPRVMAVRG